MHSLTGRLHQVRCSTRPVEPTSTFRWSSVQTRCDGTPPSAQAQKDSSNFFRTGSLIAQLQSARRKGIRARADDAGNPVRCPHCARWMQVSEGAGAA
eukprot:6190357-Pleurochrysis_carterae.AAC.1